MPESANRPLEYYARPGIFTDPAGHGDLFDSLPRDLRELCRIVQGNLLHVFWAQRYGVDLSEERQGEVGIRPVSEMLARIRAVDERPLTVARPPDRRLVGNCRTFSTLLCAMLRHQGVPARARCGFSTYFGPDHYEDHWVCEYWRGDQQRWVMVDAQLDDVQRETLGITFDPCDVPFNGFLPGGKGWQLCRAGLADPNCFGIFDMKGLWFIRGDLIRDLASLNKVETLPWDAWGLIAGDDASLTADDLAFLDRVADLTLAENRHFSKMQALYEGDDRLRAPAGWEG